MKKQNNQEFDSTIIFDAIVNDSDEEDNQIYQQIKPIHLNDKKKNFDLKISL